VVRNPGGKRVSKYKMLRWLHVKIKRSFFVHWREVASKRLFRRQIKIISSLFSLVSSIRVSLFPQIDIDESQLGCVTHEIHGAVQIEFFHDVGAVILDSFNTDA